MKYTNKQFQNIISQAWLNGNKEVRNYVQAVKEELINGAEYSRKDQRNILSRIYLLESDSAQREIIYEAEEWFMINDDKRRSGML